MRRRAATSLRVRLALLVGHLPRGRAATLRLFKNVNVHDEITDLLLEALDLVVLHLFPGRSCERSSRGAHCYHAQTGVYQVCQRRPILSLNRQSAGDVKVIESLGELDVRMGVK